MRPRDLVELIIELKFSPGETENLLAVIDVYAFLMATAFIRFVLGTLAEEGELELAPA